MVAIAPEIRSRAPEAVASPDDREARTAAENWQIIANVSTAGLFALATLAALYLMKDVIVPVILAWVVANILSPVVAWLEKRKFKRGTAVAIVTVAMLSLLAIIVLLLSLPLTYWLGRATELTALLKTKLDLMAQPLDFLKEVSKAVTQATGGGAGSGLHVEQNSNIVTSILSILTPAVTQGILFIGALIFYLIYQKKIKMRSVLVLPSRDARLTAMRILGDIERNTTVYFGTFTIVNICLGFVTALMAYAVGLPNPLLWGVLAGVLNYVPYIGPAIMIAVLFLIGLFTFPTLPEAFMAPVIFALIVTVEGHFITPTLMGKRMTMNPFAVFLAIGFWTWMWGPIGAFVAVPILMAVVVTFRHLFPKDAPELPG